jgi:UDPglucose 6-dehydrogenase
MSRIFIVGSGVVGTATGKGFLAFGHDVTFIDILESRVEQLRGEGLDARTTLDLRDEPPSFVFLTLPTPNAGHRYDLSAFASGTTSVGTALKGASDDHTVVVRSTVPPGTTESLVQPLLDEYSGKECGEGYALACNPEFLRAASAAEDFRWPWMTVIASRSARTVERLRDLLTPFGGAMQIFTDPASAELVKCAHNIYNATKISFWNEMWLVAQRLGLDLDPIAHTVARSAEGSFNPLYGIRGGAPYGGVCLPKDTQGFLGLAADAGVEMPLLRAVVEVNDRLAAVVEDEVVHLTQPATNGDRSASGGPLLRPIRNLALFRRPSQHDVEGSEQTGRSRAS